MYFITTGHGDAKSYKHSTVGPRLILYISTWWTHRLVYLGSDLGLHSSLHTKGRFHLPQLLLTNYLSSWFGEQGLSPGSGQRKQNSSMDVFQCGSVHTRYVQTSCSPQLSAVQRAHKSWEVNCSYVWDIVFPHREINFDLLLTAKYILVFGRGLGFL